MYWVQKAPKKQELHWLVRDDTLNAAQLMLLIGFLAILLWWWYGVMTDGGLR